MQIKHRFISAVLWEGECENIREELIAAVKADADLAGAYLAGANLAGADLAGAYLARAYLARANLARADLARADLAGADLAGADLADARGILPALCTPLLMLLDQPGPIRAYKLVTADRKSPMAAGNGYAPLDYADGAELSVDKANEDPNEDCGEGLHVATLPWCLSQRQAGQRILVVEFTANDIACIPNDASGKFRVRRLKVIGEKQIPEGAT